MVLVIPLFVLAAVFVVYGLSATNKSWADGFTGWLANSWLNVGLLGVVLAQQSLKLAQWVANKLGQLADPLVEMAVQWVSSIRLVTIGLWVSGLEAPVEAFRVTSALVWHVIPNAIKNATLSTVHTVTRIVPIVERLPGRVVKYVRVSEAQLVRALDHAWPALTHGYLDSWNWLRRHERQLAAAIAATAGALTVPGILTHDLPVPFGRTVANIRRLLRRLAAVGSVGFAVAMFTAAISRLGLKWLRCTNVTKAGKAICRAPLGWLENLLAGLVVVYGVVNIRTLARETYDLLGIGAHEVQKFWTGGIGGLDTNPALGEAGSLKGWQVDASYTAPNPSLGDVA